MKSKPGNGQEQRENRKEYISYRGEDHVVKLGK